MILWQIRSPRNLLFLLLVLQLKLKGWPRRNSQPTWKLRSSQSHRRQAGRTTNKRQPQSSLRRKIKSETSQIIRSHSSNVRSARKPCCSGVRRWSGGIPLVVVAFELVERRGRYKILTQNYRNIRPTVVARCGTFACSCFWRATKLARKRRLKYSSKQNCQTFSQQEQLWNNQKNKETLKYSSKYWNVAKGHKRQYGQ